MAKNSGKGHRVGIIKGRTQIYNPKTKQYVKRGEGGKFVSSKKTPYKSIRREGNVKTSTKK